MLSMALNNDSSGDIGAEMMALMERLYPICRSQTGDGVRQTLQLLGEIAPVDLHEVPSGTRVFDWTVPKEWNIRDAWVRNSRGERVIDFKLSNLHIVNGSMPVRRTMTWSELAPKLHTLPDQPDLVPYRTCFFKEDWGFCLSFNAFKALEAEGNQTYEVVIDSTLEDGSLTYGEIFVPGETSDEVLFSAHICHPSLANDNLSGLCVAALLARQLLQRQHRRFSYRFVFAPATIGAITWLARNQNKLDRIKHGLVLTLLGDAGQSTYKRSREGTAPIDRIVEHVLGAAGDPFEARDFVPYGYDERQYCSPGINLPMGVLMRTPDGEFPEYHTSADNLAFIDAAALADSYSKCLGIIDVIENDARLINTRPFAEPFLGAYGLYQSMPSDIDVRRFQRAVQWVLNLSDGRASLLDIAIRAGLPFPVILEAARRLGDCGLLAGPGREGLQRDKAVVEPIGRPVPEDV